MPAPDVFELGFSPLGSFVITWQRSTKDANGDAVKNLKVWRTLDDAAGPEGERGVVGKFVQKNQTGWNLQYTSDEDFCARVVTNEVQFYQSADLGSVWNKLRVEGVMDFAVAPGTEHAVAVFIPERKVRPDFAIQRLQLANSHMTGTTSGCKGLHSTQLRRPRITKDVFQRRQSAAEVE